jgi:class 3 adenylate cyclase
MIGRVLYLVVEADPGGVVVERPSGTVTFVFTDLEDSTRLSEEEAEAMTGALARHDAIVRAAIGSHHGRVVKTTGDGFHGVFACPDTR